MRTSGILMHISSLPGPYGIGTFGKEAYKFVDFLNETNTSYWQLLPMGPTSYGDSPYQSFSSFAGNPYFIDLDTLVKNGLLKQEEIDEISWGKDTRVDYANLYDKRFPLLFLAADRFLEGANNDYNYFCEQNAFWLNDYAFFMAKKDDSKGEAWYLWDEGLKRRDDNALSVEGNRLNKEISRYKVLQFWFFEQWNALKEYAHSKNISFIGDIPIYVAYDSVEVWKEPHLFDLDGELNQVTVAGCPPDAFSADGQLWGNPIYRWDEMRKDGFEWWKKRLSKTLEMFDVVRIDHFRGFASYYTIPAKDKNAKGGHWNEGPRKAFFDCMQDSFGKMNIIAEDLGYLTDDVFELMKTVGYPGMKVLQFAFGEDNGKNLYYPHNYDKNCVVYTGTHDNDTTFGWYRELPENVKKQVCDYFGKSDAESATYAMIRGAFASVADLCVVPMQDYLQLDSKGRMNMPSTLGGNWEWRMNPNAITKELVSHISTLNRRYNRIKD